MKRLLILLVNKLAKPLVRYYISKPRGYHYKGLRLVVLPGVFHPRFFFSTKILLNHLSALDLKGKSFLELGAGSGLIALFAAKNGALVTASDISSRAVENVKQNQTLNRLFFPVIHSDLFNGISPQTFDVIAINPPYYKKDPVSEADHAWYCGKNSDYFIRLFVSLRGFIHARTLVIMVLSDVCDIPLIISIAKQHGFEMKQRERHELLLEKNFIFSIEVEAA